MKSSLWFRKNLMKFSKYKSVKSVFDRGGSWHYFRPDDSIRGHMRHVCDVSCSSEVNRLVWVKIKNPIIARTHRIFRGFNSFGFNMKKEVQ
jgi:hypothetical protein